MFVISPIMVVIPNDVVVGISVVILLGGATSTGHPSADNERSLIGVGYIKEPIRSQSPKANERKNPINTPWERTEINLTLSSGSLNTRSIYLNLIYSVCADMIAENISRNIYNYLLLYNDILSRLHRCFLLKGLTTIVLFMSETAMNHFIRGTGNHV